MPTVLAPAKINLYLHVTGKRADGYHLLDSMAVFAHDVCDTLTIEHADRFSLSLSGPFGETLKQADGVNLVERAARGLGDIAGIRPDVRIHIEKNIPLGAGLGGGSSDAAAAVRGLCALWDLPQDSDALQSLLLSLGADVPVCHHMRSCRFEGIGEHLFDVPRLPPLTLLLVYPGGHSSTKDVFAKRSGPFSPPADIPDDFADAPAFVSFLETTGNDLTDAAQGLLPVIADAQTWMERQDGCLLARMSGSGSCVFGLFQDREAASTAEQKIREGQPHWWARTTTLI